MSSHSRRHATSLGCLAAASVLLAAAAFRLTAQPHSDWRISPEKINIVAGADRPLQVLDASAQELHGAEWSVDQATLADVREEYGRAVLHAKAAGTVRVTATLHGDRRFNDIKIWPAEPPVGTTHWGTHPIGREIGDIAAVPTGDGPSIFSLEQTAGGNTYLRGVRDDGIQLWNWLMPEETHDVELVCGDWMGGALVSANRADAYTLYTVGNDGKLRWQRTLPGVRKAHAYNLEHLIHLVSQSPDGTVTKITGLDEVTGEQKFELTVPPSRATLTNVSKTGTRLLCAANSSSTPVRTLTSSLFVNIDGLAYVAFTENDWTLAAARTCTPGATLAARDVNFARKEKLLLWQIRPDGTYRSTVVEEAHAVRPLSEPASVASPTGDLIPDGLGGVLLSVRRAPAALGDDVPGPTDGLVYRLNQDGEPVYKLLLPRHEGKLHDAMVLGQENVLAFATRGGTLLAFNVQDGKEIWQWTSPHEIEVFASLANGGCLVQTPTAVVEVDDAVTSREVFHGKAMIDWQGHIYAKHN